MTDPWNPDGSADDDPVLPDGPPPPPGAAFDPDQILLDPAEVMTTETTSSSGIGMRVVAGIVGLVLLVGGIGFAVANLGEDDGSPEEAVDEFFAAIADEDVLGMLAALDPGEREAMLDPLQDFVAELERLEVLDPSFALDGVDGFDLEFRDLTYRTEEVRDGLVRVHLVTGTVTYAFESAEFPVGDFVTDTLERFEVDWDISESDADAIAAEDDDAFLAVRNGSDGWRVSIGYTIAEQARREALLAPPDPALGLVALGAETPEGAVEGFLRAATILDVEGMVARLSPNELRALHEYWPLVYDDDAVPAPEELGVNITLDRIDLRSDVDGDTALVYIDGFDVRVEADGMVFGLDVGDGCFEITGDLDALEVPEEFRGPLCQDDIDDLFEEFNAQFEQSVDGTGIGQLADGFPEIDPSRQPDLGIVTHRVDGGWYLAPMSTSMQTTVAALSVIDRAHLDAFVDIVDAFTQAFLGPVTFSDDFGLEGAFPDDAFDSPILGTPELDPETQAALEQLAQLIAPDADGAACFLDSLYFFASTQQLEELARAFREDDDPSEDARQAFDFAVQSCGG